MGANQVKAGTNKNNLQKFLNNTHQNIKDEVKGLRDSKDINGFGLSENYSNLMVVLYDFSASTENQLSIKRNQLVRLLGLNPHKDWSEVKLLPPNEQLLLLQTTESGSNKSNKQTLDRGWVPTSYLTQAPPNLLGEFNDIQSTNFGSNNCLMNAGLSDQSGPSNLPVQSIAMFSNNPPNTNNNNNNNGNTAQAKGVSEKLVPSSNGHTKTSSNSFTTCSGKFPNKALPQIPTMNGTNGSNTSANQLYQVLSVYSWFHGPVSRQAGEHLLRSGITGCYLVRASESAPGQLSVTVRHSGRVYHYRISQDAHGLYYITDSHRFTNVAQLIEHHSHYADGLVCPLLYPAPKPSGPNGETSSMTGVSMDTNHQMMTSDGSGPLMMQPPYVPGNLSTNGSGGTGSGTHHQFDGWEIDRSEIIMKHKLGWGQYGDVYEAMWMRYNTRVAVKTVKQEANINIHDFLDEANIMKNLRHCNLVQLLGVCTREPPFYLVTEYMPFGNLLNYLRNKNPIELTPPVLLYMAVQIASGMAYLEENNLIHRDLAARNCLVGERNLIKVADFGLARYVEINQTYTAKNGAKFPIKWTAPEGLAANTFSSKSDVWAFGVVLWELATYGQAPYPGLQLNQVYEYLEKGYRMERPHGCPEKIHSIMIKCWTWNSQQRPSFNEILVELKQIQDNLNIEAEVAMELGKSNVMLLNGNSHQGPHIAPPNPSMYPIGTTPLPPQPQPLDFQSNALMHSMMLQQQQQQKYTNNNPQNPQFFQGPQQAPPPPPSNGKPHQQISRNSSCSNGSMMFGQQPSQHLMSPNGNNPQMVNGNGQMMGTQQTPQGFQPMMHFRDSSNIMMPGTNVSVLSSSGASSIAGGSHHPHQRGINSQLSTHHANSIPGSMGHLSDISDVPVQMIKNNNNHPNSKPSRNSHQNGQYVGHPFVEHHNKKSSLHTSGSGRSNRIQQRPQQAPRKEDDYYYETEEDDGIITSSELDEDSQSDLDISNGVELNKVNSQMNRLSMKPDLSKSNASYPDQNHSSSPSLSVPYPNHKSSLKKQPSSRNYPGNPTKTTDQSVRKTYSNRGNYSDNYCENNRLVRNVHHENNSNQMPQFRSHHQMQPLKGHQEQASRRPNFRQSDQFSTDELSSDNNSASRIPKEHRYRNNAQGDSSPTRKRSGLPLPPKTMQVTKNTDSPRIPPRVRGNSSEVRGPPPANEGAAVLVESDNRSFANPVNMKQPVKVVSAREIDEFYYEADPNDSLSDEAIDTKTGNQGQVDTPNLPPRIHNSPPRLVESTSSVNKCSIENSTEPSESVRQCLIENGAAAPCSTSNPAAYPETAAPLPPEDFQKALPSGKDSANGVIPRSASNNPFADDEVYQTPQNNQATDEPTSSDGAAESNGTKAQLLAWTEQVKEIKSSIAKLMSTSYDPQGTLLLSQKLELFAQQHTMGSKLVESCPSALLDRGEIEDFAFIASKATDQSEIMVKLNDFKLIFEQISFELNV